jgi:polyisoprenoid-binding protein YceI
MNTPKFYKIILLIILLFLIGSLRAQNNYSISNYVATINGTSNVANWRESIEKIWGNCILMQNTEKAISLQSFKIGLQVKSIKGEQYPLMSNLTYKALKGDKFPEITFTLAEPVANMCCGLNTYSVAARGRLTIAGVTREIITPIKFTFLDDKKVTIEVEQQVKMTDYGVSPPTALFGLVKTGDVITINFKTVFLADGG